MLSDTIVDNGAAEVHRSKNFILGAFQHGKLDESISNLVFNIPFEHYKCKRMLAFRDDSGE